MRIFKDLTGNYSVAGVVQSRMQTDNIRDEQLLIALRPDISLNVAQSLPEETFQNQTLRPILKLQHTLLTEMFLHYIHKRKDIYYTLSKQARLKWIEHSIRTDLRFKNTMVGAVIGHFSAGELQTFYSNESEYMRRLTDLLVQRLQGHLY